MSDAAALSPRAEARRERLLDAAETVFTREGLRGASMERIATEAGVARATVYAYFTDKEDAFRQVSQRLAGRLVQAVTDVLAEPGTPAQRIRDAVLAKHRLAWQVARTSPYAADLLAAKDRLAGPLFSAADADIERKLACLFHEIGSIEPDQAAAVLLAASKGIAASAENFSRLSADLGRLLDWVVGPR